jgi:acyl-CoA thioester hydrolase
MYVESRTRVRYKDTDQMGIAHHANYLVWFEIGRTDLCRQTGISYAEIEARGFVLVVTDVACRYRVPYRYDQCVLIRTSVAASGSRIMRFAYELLDERGETVHALGSTSHMWLDKVTRRPARADADVTEAFAPWVTAASGRP